MVSILAGSESYLYYVKESGASLARKELSFIGREFKAVDCNTPVRESFLVRFPRFLSIGSTSH